MTTNNPSVPEARGAELAGTFGPATSANGHIERMAHAVAEGVRSVEGSEVTIRRVAELVPEETARQAGMKVDHKTPIATLDELANYDAIIFGTPTRFGNMTAQMRNFLDQTGGLCVKAR